MRVPFVAAVFLLTTVTTAMGTTKHERCEHYARNAAASTPTSTGVVRGAARGAVGGAIFGNAGAATGAVIGTARHANQKRRSYQYYYDSCMSR